jgi:ABC-type glycerol-3-phosphate transport system substrate-binding protein
MERYASEHGIELVKVPMAYQIFMEKVTAGLTSGNDQFDIVWHNDDWGQIWKKWLEPTDDVVGMDQVDPIPVDVAFLNDEGRRTVVPMVHTFGMLFYRTDLIGESEAPKTWAELVAVSQRLQAEGKVKWGFVGGMAMNHTWFTWLWSLWANNCDVLAPPYERDNDVLAAAGWESMLGEECSRQMVEFWWDAMNTHKISPPGMPSYSRDDANAIFKAGDAAFTVADTTLYGDFDDPQKSRVAGKIALGALPLGEMRDAPFGWNSIWGWAIPTGISAERKALAKEVLGGMLMDREGQLALWSATAGPPPNREFWADIAENDPRLLAIKTHVLDLPDVAAGAYYMPSWPRLHKAFSDAVIAAVTGKREDIPAVLAEGAKRVHQAAVE